MVCTVRILWILKPESCPMPTVSDNRYEIELIIWVLIDLFLFALRCFRVFTEEPKKIPVSQTVNTQPTKKTTATATRIMTLIEKQKKESLEQIQKKFQLSEGVKWVSNIWFMNSNSSRFHQKFVLRIGNIWKKKKNNYNSY